jgi:hypothetical protein
MFEIEFFAHDAIGKVTTEGGPKYQRHTSAVDNAVYASTRGN